MESLENQAVIIWLTQSSKFMIEMKCIRIILLSLHPLLKLEKICLCDFR
jgi:hypothetical protein